MYNKTNSIIEVSLASHVQKVPQVGCPHKDPVNIDINEKVNPIGAKLLVKIVNILNLKIKLIREKTLIAEKIINANHEEGT
tara:strand:+ start:265 stop:507 length:243 start_codon:yes stop_codon:yes gene_type:complete